MASSLSEIPIISYLNDCNHPLINPEPVPQPPYLYSQQDNLWNSFRMKIQSRHFWTKKLPLAFHLTQTQKLKSLEWFIRHFFFYCFVESGSHHVAQAGLKFLVSSYTTCLGFPSNWDHKREPLHWPPKPMCDGV